MAKGKKMKERLMALTLSMVMVSSTIPQSSIAKTEEMVPEVKSPKTEAVDQTEPEVMSPKTEVVDQTEPEVMSPETEAVDQTEPEVMSPETEAVDQGVQSSISVNDSSYSFDKATGTLTVNTIAGTTDWRSEGSIENDKVKQVIIAPGVTEIRAGAFSQCTNLTKVTLPESLTTIGWSAFSGCTALTQITLPESLTALGGFAFANCTSLPQITLPGSLTTIGESAFQDCSSLTQLTLPESLTTIGAGAFSQCSNLTQLTLPESLTTIGRSAFSGCTALTQITLPESLTALGEYAFANCTSLPQLTLPESLTTIGEYAFQNCSSLTQLTLPESLTTIGEYAFYNCTNLTQLTIPKNVTKIGSYVFSYTGLKTINVKAETPPTLESGVFEKVTGATAYVPKGKLAIYSTSPWGSIAGVTLKEEREESYSFDPETGTLTAKTNSGTGGWRGGISPAAIKNVIIEPEVTTIGEDAFYDCENLISVDIKPNSQLTIINAGAFNKAIRLESINIPEGLTTLGEAAFNDCAQLKSIKIPAGVTKIEKETFNGCSALVNVSIADSVIEIGAYAFGGVSSLTEITIPASVTKIGAGAFGGTNMLKTFNVKAILPPSLDGTVVFNGVPEGATAYIPKGTLGEYQKTGWNVLKLVAEKNSITLTQTAGGTISADKTAAEKGEKVTLKATPEAGYQFKEWKVTAGGVTIKDNAFTMGTANVSIEGIFEKAPTPTPGPTPGPTPTPGSNPTAKTASTNVKTGMTDTTMGTYCVVILLALTGLGVLGFKRKFNK